MSEYEHDHPYPNAILMEGQWVGGVGEILINAGTRIQVTEWPENSGDPKAATEAVAPEKPGSEYMIEFYPCMSDLIGIHKEEGGDHLSLLIPPKAEETSPVAGPMSKEQISQALLLVGAANMAQKQGYGPVVDILCAAAVEYGSKALEGIG